MTEKVLLAVCARAGVINQATVIASVLRLENKSFILVKEMSLSSCCATSTFMYLLTLETP